MFKEFITEINAYFEPEESQKVKSRGTDILATVPLTQSWVEDEVTIYTNIMKKIYESTKESWLKFLNWVIYTKDKLS